MTDKEAREIEKENDRRMRLAIAIRAHERLQITDATKLLMKDLADGKVTSDEAVKKIIGSYAPIG